MKENKENWIRLHDSIFTLDNGLLELGALADVLHTALDGKDELSPETIQSYVDVMSRQIDELNSSLTNTMSFLSAIIEDQDQDEEDLNGAPLLVTDPEGNKTVYWSEE